MLLTDGGMTVLFLCPSIEEQYNVPLGSVLNAKFLLRDGNFQTDIFSTLDVNGWLVLHFIFSSVWCRRVIEGREGP